MSFDDPLKRLGFATVDRLLEHERSQREMIERLTRPFGTLGKHTAVDDAARRLADFSASPTMVRMIENAAIHSEIFEKYQSLLDRPSSWSRIAAMRDASFAIAEHQPAAISNFAKRAMAVADQLSAVRQLGYAHSDLIGRAIKNSHIHERFTQSGSLAHFQEIANRANSISAEFERLAKAQASIQGRSDIDAAIVRHIHDAQVAIAAMATNESAGEFADHANGLLTAVAALFSWFKSNTANEVRDMGLFGFLAAILSFLAIFELLQPEGLSKAEREQLIAIQNDVRVVREQLMELLEDEAAIDEAFVSDLPRGLTLRKAYIRTQPKRQSELIIVLPEDTPVAIYEREQQWLKVVYRDPLADQLAMGWVYRPSIEKQPH